jgi:hypothetical protein
MAALERMEAGRRVFLRGRALALAQRFALYARDELAMSTLRIRVHAPASPWKIVLQQTSIRAQPKCPVNAQSCS